MAILLGPLGSDKEATEGTFEETIKFAISDNDITEEDISVCISANVKLGLVADVVIATAGIPDPVLDINATPFGAFVFRERIIVKIVR